MQEEEEAKHKSYVKKLVRLFGVGGCTAVPDFEFTHCCDEHDIAYTTGLDYKGAPISKFQADLELWRCMNREGKTWVGRWLLSSFGFLALTIAGWSHWRGK